MFYSYEKTVSAGTSEATEETLTMEISAGIIHQVDFVFPSDASKDLHARITAGGTQVWPSNTRGTIRGDGMIISFREFYKVESWSNSLVLHAWNTATSDDLTIIVNIGVLEETVLQPFSVARLLKAIGPLPEIEE